MKFLVFLALFVVAASAQCTRSPTAEPASPIFVNGDISNTVITLNFRDSYEFTYVGYRFVSTSASASTYCDFNSTSPDAWLTHTLNNNTCVYDRQFVRTSNQVLAQCFDADTVSDPNYTVYTTTVEITTTQPREPIRMTPQTRTTVTAVRLRFRFATYMNVSLSNINVYGFAVSLNNTQRQVFNDLSGQTRVVFFTSVNYPFQLTPTSPTSATIISSGPGAATYQVTNVGVALVSDGNTYSCPNTPNVACEQLWFVVVSNTDAQVCNYQGITLTFTYTLGCNPGYVGDCSAQAQIVTAVVNLADNNFCTTVVQDVGLSAVLVPYSKADYSVVATNFIYNQRAYFRATVTASAGPTIQNTAVVQIEIVSHEKRLLLTDADASATPPTGSYIKHISADNANPNVAAFSFLVSSVTVALANPDEGQTVTVSALLRVTYVNLNGEVAHKLQSTRFGLQAQSNLQPLVDVQVALSQNTGSSTAGASSATLSAMTLYIIAAVGGVLLVAIFAGAFVAYRRQVKKLQSSSNPNLSVYV